MTPSAPAGWSSEGDEGPGLPSPPSVAAPIAPRENFRAHYMSLLGIWKQDRAHGQIHQVSEGEVASVDIPPRGIGPRRTSFSVPRQLEAVKVAAVTIDSADDSRDGGIEVDGDDSGEQAAHVAVFGNPGDLQLSASPLKVRRPASRDVRRHYLSNLGIRAGLQAGDGAPPLLRRPGADLGKAPASIVEEKLKDPKDSDLTLDDLVKVIKNLVGPGSKDGDLDKERPDICDECRDAIGSSGARCPPTCPHKRVKFCSKVAAMYVPVHSEYSNRVRQSYWASAGEIREMVYRNMIEFDAEGYQWQNAAEEPDMYYCEETGEFIHPVFFDNEDNLTEATDDGLGSAEFINEGKRYPQMEKNQGIWA